MRIVVTSTGRDLDAPASPVFGRCPVYIFVNTETWEFKAVDNPAMSAAGGAGIQAAQFVVEQGAKAILSGHVGPNAYNVIQAAGVPLYTTNEGTVREAVEAYLAGQLPTAADATVRAHAGMGSAMRSSGTASSRNTAPARDQEIVTLQQMASDLRRQLADIVERIDQLEGKE